MFKRITAAVLTAMLIFGMLSGCDSTPAEQPSTPAAPVETAEPAAPTEPPEPVVLTVAGPWEEFRALDLVAQAFTAQYPNCTVVYEYLQDYDASLEKRLGGAQPVDLLISNNIQADSPLLPYVLELNGCAELDLSSTFDGLIKNYMMHGESGESARLYSIPLGAELRGMYVNKSLLAKVGLSVPTDRASLIEACRVLKENGYIPFHGNPGNFAQSLIYPAICNSIANADDPAATYAAINAHEAGVTEIFRDPMEFLYSLVENGYYDYKRAQTELNLFIDSADEAYARDFLNIIPDGDSFVRGEGVGNVAFLPSAMTLMSTFDKVAEDYHSEIEYEFIMAPIGEEGGYAYMSPARGIAAYKDSANLEWSVRFLNFLFTPENNKLFAGAFNIIPNTADAFTYITDQFDIPDDCVSHLGEVTFDYGFYDVIVPHIVDISKANNPKYMSDDGSGNLSLYPLEHYIERMEASLAEQ